jgi:hypothetical protein
MRGMWIGGTALLLLGGALPVQAADKDAPAGGGGILSWSIWGTKDKQAKPAVADKPAALPTVDEAAQVRQRELNAFYRRMYACYRLQEIADLTGNEDLRRQAEQLLQRNWTVYQQRTGGAPGGSGGFVSDDATLEKRLGTGAAGLQPAAGRPEGNGAQAGLLRGNER